MEGGSRLGSSEMGWCGYRLFGFEEIGWFWEWILCWTLLEEFFGDFFFLVDCFGRKFVDGVHGLEEGDK